MSVRERAGRSWGNSCVSANMLGERTAGQRKRRKIQAEMRCSATSRRFRSSQRSFRLANTSFSSLQHRDTASTSNTPATQRNFLHVATQPKRIGGVYFHFDLACNDFSATQRSTKPGVQRRGPYSHTPFLTRGQPKLRDFTGTIFVECGNCVESNDTPQFRVQLHTVCSICCFETQTTSHPAGSDRARSFVPLFAPPFMDLCTELWMSIVNSSGIVSANNSRRHWVHQLNTNCFRVFHKT